MATVDWSTAPIASSNPLTEEDFAVPEFKQNTEVSSVTDRGEDYSAMGAPPKTASSIDWSTAPTATQGVDWSTAPITPTEIPKAGSTDKPFQFIPTKEDFKAGFAGRILAGKGKEILPDANTPSISESFGALVTAAKEHPMGVVQDLYTGIIVDPWMLIPGLWEATPAKLAALSAKYVSAAAKVAPIAGKAAAVSTKVARAGVIGGGAELAAQSAEMARGERSEFDTQAAANTAAQFGAFAGVAKAVSEAFKPAKVEVKPREEAKVSPESEVMVEDLPRETATKVIEAQNMIDVEALKAKKISDAVRVATGNNADQLKRIFEAIDNPSKKTKLKTDLERQTELYGDGSRVLGVDGKPIIIGREQGVPIYATNKGMSGAIPNMERKLSRGINQLTELEAGNPIKGKQIFKNMDEATAYADSIPKAKSAFEYLKNLPSEEHLIPYVDKLRDLLFKDGVAARDAGVTQGLVYNYFTHLIDSSKSNLPKEATAKIIENLYKEKPEIFKTDSSNTRIYKTARDLQDRLNSIGANLYVHTDAALVFEAYHKAITTSIAQKGIIDNLKATKDFKGNPLITSDPAIAFQNKYVTYNGPGNKQIQGQFVHPSIAPVLDHMFQRADIGAVKDTLLQTAMLTKAANVAGSLFHAPSLGLAIAGVSPALAFKEIVTLGSGIRKAVNEFKKADMEPEVNYAMKSGVKLGTEDINRSIVADTGAWLDSKILGNKEGKLVQRITHPLDKYILEKMNTFTWDYMHTGGKLLLFNHLLTNAERNIKIEKYMPDNSVNPEWTAARDVVAKEIATSVNDTMGGLQWLQAANSIENKFLRNVAIKGTGIESRAWGQIAMFAPDWTVSTLRAFTNSLPKDMLKPSSWDIKGGVKGIMKPMTKGDLARRYIINTGLLYLTLLNGINMYTAGQYIWENEDPTRILHEDGTTQQLAKHSMESVHWMMDFGSTLQGKLGFAPKAAMEIMDKRSGNLLERSVNVAKLALPFSVGSGLNAPEGEGMKRVFLSSAGFPIYGKPTANLRDPADVEKERRARAETRAENLQEKAALEATKAKRGRLFGLFDEYL
jgi:hypothetical protein